MAFPPEFLFNRDMAFYLLIKNFLELPPYEYQAATLIVLSGIKIVSQVDYSPFSKEYDTMEKDHDLRQF